MKTILDYDVTDLLSDALIANRRAPDGLLHPSGDLLGSLRHSQLRAAGAPTIENPLLSEVRLATGTMWHDKFERVFRGKPVMLELKLDRWLPEGWSGTADWIMWSSEYNAFVLGDLKTIKPEGMRWIENDGIKKEHIWQVSSYWHALRRMGLPLVKGFYVYYLPMSPLDNIKPMLLEGTPISEDIIIPVMEARWDATKRYLNELREKGGITFNWPDGSPPVGNYVQRSLAAVQEREQVIRWNKTMNVFDVKLQPHWSAAYCPFPDVLCDCRNQRVEKIGHFTKYDALGEDPCTSDCTDCSTAGKCLLPTAVYEPRKGYEQIELTVELDKKQKGKLLG